MRAAIPILLALMGTAGIAGEAIAGPPPATGPENVAPAVPPALFSPAQRAALAELYRRAVAAGLPDATGGTLYRGTVVMSEPAAAKPAAEEDADDRDLIQDQAPVRWRRQIQDVQTVDGRTLTTFDKGVHLRLADGRWMISLRVLMTPDASHVLTPGEGAVEIAPGALAAQLSAGKSTRDSSREDERTAEFSALFTPEARGRLAASLAMLQRLPGFGFAFYADSDTFAALHLLRLGVPEAEGVLLAGAASTAFPHALLRIRPPTEAGPLHLISSRYGRTWRDRLSHQQESDWDKFRTSHPGTLTIPPVEVLVGHLLAQWFHHQLLEEGDLAANGLTASQAIEGLLAFTPASEQAALRPVAAMLVARLALPVKAAADADLATRLQSWDPASQGRRQAPPDIDESTLATLPPEVQRHLRAQLAQSRAWRPTEEEIPALLGLLDDARSCRWLDGQRPRTLGDNALRALAALIGFDPRLLIGRDPAGPWTEAERTATAAALRLWWKGLAGKPINEGLAAMIGTLPPAAMLQLLAAKEPPERQPLLTAVVAAWTAKPPLDLPPGEVAGVLASAGDHAGLTALVKTWKPLGPLRPMLACWRDQHGDPASLDAVLAELAGQPANDANAAGNLAVALARTLEAPSLGRLHSILALAALPPEDRRLWAMLNALADPSATDEAWQAVEQLPSSDPGRNRRNNEATEFPERALRLAITCLLLADRRLIPDRAVGLTMHDADYGMLAIAGNSFGLSFDTGDKAASAGGDAAKKPSPRQPPTGLRIRDVAATVLADHLGHYRLDDGPDQPLPPPDLWAPVEVRDRAVQALADAFSEPARAALTAAKLPIIVPSAAPAAGSDKALF